MKLWKVAIAEKYGSFGYDCYNGFVIRAPDATRARYIAGGEAADEGRDVWLDPRKTLCYELNYDGDEGIILTDFNAG